MGEHVGLTPQQISKYERGESCMTLGLYREICEYLGGEVLHGFAEEQAPYNAPANARVDVHRRLKEIKGKFDALALELAEAITAAEGSSPKRG